MKFLKKHPFAVEAFFESSLVLTYALPKQQLQKFLPEFLQLDTFKDQWAFIAVAMVQTSRLRPKGFPKFMGNDFFLIGYRIFVNFIPPEGKRLRGLYILKSETNKKSMERLGNLFTHYRYTTTDIQQSIQHNTSTLSSQKSKFHVTIEKTPHPVELPANSPFGDWKEARRFAGPLPFTFTYLREDQKVLIIEGVRQHWNPQPVKVIADEFEFLNKLKLQSPLLANAFEIKNVPYYWKKGRVASWNPNAVRRHYSDYNEK